MDGMDDTYDASRTLAPGRSPKTRSLSDGGGTPSKLSPSPLIIEANRRASKDDSSIHNLTTPVTPSRPSGGPRRSGLALQMPREGTPPAGGVNGGMIKPGLGTQPGVPLSPKVDHAHIYASHAHSPTNILPRRSRGLDFSRAATSLHHSTLAEHSSPDSSPTMGGRAMNMNIPGNQQGRRTGDWASLGPEQSSSSLWSVMGSRAQEKMNLSGSVGSASHNLAVDSSSSDEDGDFDEEMEDDVIMTTPQMNRTGMGMGSAMGMPPIGAPFGSPAMGSLMSFQQRQRQRKPLKKKGAAAGRGPWTNNLAKSPPQGGSGSAARRESISWQANQLKISGSGAESDDGQRGPEGGMTIRKVAGRRANMLPKTKHFARIRAALMEESAPADTDVRQEAEVIKQVRDSDPPPPAAQTHHIPHPPTESAASSPNLNNDLPLDEPAMRMDNDDDMMGDLTAGLSSSFKQTAMKNSKGKNFWDTFSESSGRMTPPPPTAEGSKGLGRGSSSGMSEDWGMDSPQGLPQGFTQPQPPSAAEITRRINNKRRRDDDFDPVSFKRRAVSPGLSVHGSPVTQQSPMQRGEMPWGGGAGGGGGAGVSRPGSNGRESDCGSVRGGSGGNGSGSGSGSGNGKGRVGFQGMVDTNDGIMRMSIE